MSCFVGVDIGGTKTHIMVSRRGRTVHDRILPTSEWRVGALTETRTNARNLMAALGELVSEDCALVVGAHGLDNEAQTVRFRGWLEALHPGPLLVMNDVELLPPAAGYASAISVIAGTGSKIVGRDARGGLVTAGGHGYLIDDHGSAPAIVRDAVHAVVDAADRGLPEDILGRTLRAHFDVEDVVELATAFCRTVSATAWGALAPSVFECASSGSALALSVIEKAAQGLAAQVAIAHARGAVAEAIVCGGGVITAQPRLVVALESALAERGLFLPVTVLAVPPAFGALVLASQLEAPLRD